LYKLDNASINASAQKLDVTDMVVDVTADEALAFPVDIAAEDTIPLADANAAVQQSFSEPQTVKPELSFDLGTVEAADQSNDNQSFAPSDDVETQSQIASSQLLEDDDSQNVLAKSDVTAGNINTTATDLEGLSLTTDNAIDFDVSELSATKIGSASSQVDAAEKPTALDDPISSVDNPVTNVLDLSAMNTSTPSQENDFDMDFDVPAQANATSLESLEQKSELVADAIQDISFDFEADEPLKAVAPQSDNTSDLSFDFSDDDVLPEITAEEKEPRANELDLSTISFDLDEDPANSEAATPNAKGVTEPPEVEIKLDLVAAYMDMGDKEGARELLEEVIKEGSEQQQLRAEKLLTNLS
jgi:pilus assembly protein FimV